MITDLGTAPDHAMLIAAVAVRQAGTRTAQVAGRTAIRTGARDPVRALVATFLNADTAAAAGPLNGSFHPRVASATAAAPSSTLMKPPFTLAF